MSFDADHWPALPRDCDTGEPLEIVTVFPQPGHKVRTLWQQSLFGEAFCIDAIQYQSSGERTPRIIETTDQR